MSQPNKPDADPRIDRVPLPPPSGRDKLIAVLLMLGLATCVVLSVLKWIGEFDTKSLVLVLGFLGVVAAVVVAEFYRQGAFTWMRLARRPVKAMLRGDLAAAEQAYRSALARANRFDPQDSRRARMQWELIGYLISQGRWQEARALAEECVAILSLHPSENRDNYLLAVQHFSVFLVASKDYQSAQRLLDEGMEAILMLKKPGGEGGGKAAGAAGGPALEGWDFALQSVLAYLLIEAGDLGHAECRLREVEAAYSRFDARGKNSYQDSLFLLRAHWHCAAGQGERAKHWCDQARVGTSDIFDVRVRAQVEFRRQNYVGAEQMLRDHLEMQGRLGTARRPDLLPHRVTLADALFHQSKHDDAFASFEEARAIVADFALPADDAWRKALATWLQRAKDLGRTELATSLEKELAQASATRVQAITILDKFRIRPRAAE